MLILDYYLIFQEIQYAFNKMIKKREQLMEI